MFRSLFLKELREQRRNHRLLIVAGALLLAGMISPLLARYTPVILRSVPGIPPELANFVPDPTILDSFVQYIKNVSQFGLIVVLITGMGSIAQEFERGTAAMLFSTPAPRWMVVLSKWLGGLSSIVVGLILATAIFSFYTWVLFGSFSLLSVLALNAFVLVFLSFYQSMALFASSLARTQGMAAAGAFGGLVLVLILDSLPVLGDYMPGELLTWGGSLFAGQIEDAWPALVFTMCLILVFLLASIWKVNNQEL